MMSSLATFLAILIVPFWAPTLVKPGKSLMRNAALRFGVGALATAAALLPVQLAFFPLGPLRLLPMDLGFLWLGAAPFWVPFLAVRIFQLGFADRAKNTMRAHV
ncbi:hypothetical protein [uncultured Tateyamaria sp.]|uniref:hypothetical protein n=1 Tax=uncultured Tateyamaria sp. TaxID=455651 RepID=UPI0026114073|nr:hypothetical protein [uncultured Tateyamaria sp.]